MNERPWYRMHWSSLVAGTLVGLALLHMQDYCSVEYFHWGFYQSGGWPRAVTHAEFWPPARIAALCGFITILVSTCVATTSEDLVRTRRFNIQLSTMFAITLVASVLALLIQLQYRADYDISRPLFNHDYFGTLYVNITGIGEAWPCRLGILVGVGCTVFKALLFCGRIARLQLQRREQASSENSR